MVLMKRLAFKEMESHGNILEKGEPINLVSTFFEDNLKFSNQILTQYCILIGKSYLSKCINPIIKKVNSKPKPYEVTLLILFFFFFFLLILDF